MGEVTGISGTQKEAKPWKEGQGPGVGRLTEKSNVGSVKCPPISHTEIDSFVLLIVQ